MLAVGAGCVLPGDPRNAAEPRLYTLSLAVGVSAEAAVAENSAPSWSTTRVAAANSMRDARTADALVVSTRPPAFGCPLPPRSVTGGVSRFRPARRYGRNGLFLA